MPVKARLGVMVCSAWGVSTRCSCGVGVTRRGLLLPPRRAGASGQLGGPRLPTPPPPVLAVDGRRIMVRQQSSSCAFGPRFNTTQATPGTESSPVVKKGLQDCLLRELSTSTKVMQYSLGQTDLVKSGHRRLLFDTHAMVQLMEDSGFASQQAEVIVKMLVNITNSNMDIMYGDMVTKTQQVGREGSYLLIGVGEKNKYLSKSGGGEIIFNKMWRGHVCREIMLQKVMSHIAAVKKDMIILEKSEFSAILAENERIKVELVQLKMQLSDVMNKERLDNKLDMNLEKSQVKEMKAEHERRLLETRNKMMEMLTEQDRHVTQNNVKIDTEVAGLKTMLESHKLDSIKYLAGSVFTCLTVVLGFYRIWM